MLKPLFDRVVIKPFEEVKTTESGLYIPANSQEKPNQGEVISVGSEVKYIKAGDKVIFNNYHTGLSLVYEKQPVKIMREDDIFAIID